MTMSLVLAFGLVSLILAVTPGADWAYAISAGMQDRALLPAVTGLLLGYLAITVPVAIGAGALIAGSPVLLTALTVLGAAYLLWLGVGLLRDPPVLTIDDTHAASRGQWLAKGFGVSGLNVKGLLLFLALLPQFTVNTGTAPIAAQVVVLGLVHIVNCGVVYTAVGLCSRAVLRTRPAAARVVGRVSGSIMVALAIVLVVERVPMEMA